jgi:hypothetical protein
MTKVPSFRRVEAPGMSPRAVALYKRNRLPAAILLVGGASVLALVLGAIDTHAPADYAPGYAAAETDVHEFLGGGSGWGALGVAAFTLFVGWTWTGIPLMRGLRRHRVGFHTWTSLVALALALVHGLGLTRGGYTQGSLSGWLSTGMMVGLFVTGWWRAAYVDAWGLKTWRWIHWLLAVGAILIGVEHWALIEMSRPGG